MGTVSTASAPHYVRGRQCGGWHLLDDGDLGVIKERMPPDAAEQRHRHGRARQLFYVLAGEATLEMDGVAHRLLAGEGECAPPGVAHEMRNDGAADARFLVVSAPKSHGDRIAVTPEPAA